MARPEITLVFTDVVGSSAAKRAATLGADVSERDRAYLERVQSEHLRVVRSALASHRGKEMMTMGDAFFLTFEEPLDALRCCAAIQQRLSDHPIDTLTGPLRLRIGIHVGTPEYFEKSWHGTDVDIAARTQSAASPRQIVVTDAARQRMGDPLGITFRELGVFGLKGVGEIKLWDADYDQHGLRRAALPSKAQKRRARLLAASALATVLLALLVAASWLLWQQHAKEMAAEEAATSSSLIVADFDNKTGEPVFDGILTQAFTIQLQQSPVLTILSPQHLRQSRQFLGKAPDSPLTPEVAREIGLREGIKAYLTGSVSKVGNVYLIVASAVNTANGDVIASEQSQAADKDHVLEALGSVATALRTQLGESLASIQKLDRPLTEATTPSLDAFRAFSLGEVEHAKGNDLPDAEGYYRKALELDPNFALAWSRLGAAYWNTYEQGKSADCFSRAFALSKNVSERERFYIEANYYMSVTGDLQRAVDTLELACETYPLDRIFLRDLGFVQIEMGRLEESLETYHKAVLISSDGITKLMYLQALMRLDRFKEASTTLAEVQPLLVNSTGYAICRYNLHVLTGNLPAMTRDISAVKTSDDAFLMTNSVALAQEFLGQYGEAEKSWDRGAAQCAARGAKDTEAICLVYRLFGRAYAGIDSDSAQILKSALALDNTKETLATASITAAVCHQPSIALPIMEDLAKKYPEDTLITRVVLPQCRAALALGNHEPQVAVRELEGSESFDCVSQSGYLRGLAYLDLKDGPDAVAAFQNAARYRGEPLIDSLQNHGQAQLGLARAYVLCGDRVSAKKAYEDLLDLWKNADADLPQLVAAKREYASLSASSAATVGSTR